MSVITYNDVEALKNGIITPNEFREKVSLPKMNTFRISDKGITISPNTTVEDLKDEVKELKENLNRKLNISMLHGCRNCGARIDVDINKPVFCCKYCGTNYVIGTVQQNSTY